MRKLLAYFRVAIADAFIYRAEGIIWMLNDVGPAVIALIFWSAAFQTQANFAGFTYPQMLVYYLGIMFVNNVINTQPQYFLSEEIRNGDFSEYLLKPINLTLFKFASNNSWRLVRLIFFLPLLLLVAKLFAVNFNFISLSWVKLGLIVASLVMAFFINFFLKLALGLTTIWFEEAGWLFFGFDILATFLSGELIPLDFFPAGLTAANNWLPFKYLLYFPLSLVLNSGQSAGALITGFGYQFVWCLLAYILYRWIFNRGSRAYGAYGG
jgi:ABC-2 type transport system permease protein